jgi:N6-adenosine-specific RNA methylase IME4
MDHYRATALAGKPRPGEKWGRFAILYADPPWKFEEHPSTAASDTFPVMTLPELIELRTNLKVDEETTVKLDDHLMDDCVLFLWATNPNLPAAMELITGWGFEYKVHLIWKNPRSVIAHFVHGLHELLIIATRPGYKLTPLISGTPLSSIFEGPRWCEGTRWPRLNSAKPDRAYEIIEAMYPEVPKLELFARRYRCGEWTSWGNELGRYEQQTDCLPSEGAPRCDNDHDEREDRVR